MNTRKFRYDLFFSFSSSDTLAAKEIYQQFIEQDLLVFWSDDSLKSELGDSWFDKIEESLEESQHLVLYVSKNTFRPGRDWVRREYKAFLNSCYQENVRRIIPILNDDVEIADLPLFLREFQSFKVSEPEGILRLIDIIGNAPTRSVITKQENDQDKLEYPQEIFPGSDDLPVGEESETVEPDPLDEEVEKFELGSVTDKRDSSFYKTITIGNQIWLAENLNFETKSSKVYKNQKGFSKIYGRLYTWEDALQSCPDGWRLPNNNDWEKLINHMGGENIAGRKLIHSEARNIQQAGPNSDRNSGFSALFGGMCVDGTFGLMGRTGVFWSSDEYNAERACGYSIHYKKESIISLAHERLLMLSVRCLRNK